MDKTKCENCGAEVKDGILMHRLWGCREIDLVKNVFSKKNKDLGKGEVIYTHELERRSNYDSQVLKKEDGKICEHHPNRQKISASVKIMRSHDYCHFEVQLSNTDLDSLDDVDELRKDAARLVDKAVNQYIQHKEFLEWKMSMEGYYYGQLALEVKEILKKPENERTPGDKAKIKLLKDIQFHKSRHYDYPDEWADKYPKIDAFIGGCDLPY